MASILFPYKHRGFSWEDRHVDLDSCLDNEPDNNASAWALDRLRGLEVR